MRRGLAAAAASATVALALSPLFAAPAHGQSSVTVTPSKFAMSPAPGPAMPSSAVSVSGHFNASGGFQPVFDWVSVNVVWDKGGPGPSQSYAYCGAPPNTQPNPKPCTGTDFDFNQPFNPPLAFNGPYKVTATGQAHDQSFLGNSAPVSATTNPISFGMAVPAPNVNNVTAVVNKDRSVTVSFDRDAGTPDVQSYWVWRKGPGEKDFRARFQTKQLASGTRISAQPDTATEAAGGDYVYEIEEHRNGQTGDASSFTVSDRSKSASNKVTVPNPPPGQTVPPPTTPPPSSDGAPPVVKGTPSGVSRSSGFSSSGSSAATTPTSEAVTPDPGFARGLPFAAGQTPNDQNNSEGDNSAVAVTPGRHKSTNKGILIPVAGAAVLVLGALHLRYFKKRLDEPPTSLTPIA